MIYLNILYFLIISWYGYKFLTSDGRIVKSPFDKDDQLMLTGPEMFWVLTFSTGLLCMSVDFGLNLMAIRLFVLEFLCIFGLKYVQNKPVWSPPLKLYAIYLLWIVFGCFYSPAPGYGVRVFLKYLYPLLLCLFASAAVRYSEVFLKSSILARKVAIIAIFATAIPLISNIFPGLFWYPTAEAINFISIVVFSLTMLSFTGEKKNLWLAIAFCVPCLVWVFRTSIMGTALALMVFTLYKYKVRALPVVFGVLLLFVIAIFAIPSVKEKMFYKSDEKSIENLESGELTMDDIDSNGRFAMWEWSLKNFYENEKLEGSGTGNLQEVFYSLRHPFYEIRICHNDYVQILCDNGLIGIILFVTSYLLVIFHCFVVYNNKLNGPGVRMAALCAGPTLAGMMITLYTDNCVNYSVATLSMPFGFYGMMLGMKQQETTEA